MMYLPYVCCGTSALAAVRVVLVAAAAVVVKVVCYATVITVAVAIA